MAKICLIVGSASEACMDLAINSHLKVRGHTVYCVTYQAEAQAVFQEAGASFLHLPDHLQADLPPDPMVLETLDTKYQEPGLPFILNSDVLLRQGDYDRGLSVIVSYLQFWEDFFERNDTDVLLMYVTARSAGRTAYAVARTRGIHRLIIQAGVAHGKFSLCDKNEDWIWSELLDHLASGETVSAKSEVTDKVNSLIDQISDFKKITNASRPSLKGFIQSSVQIATRRSSAIHKNEWHKLYRHILWWYLPWLRLPYDLPDHSEKYIFFPLHASWDAQILTRNPLYYNQLELVRQVALSLPENFKLYVKEHPYNIGGETRKSMQSIQQLHNVRVIGPQVNSKLLIQNSQAVFVINGTAGWEAFLFKKPVIVCGKPFFRYSSLVYGIDEFNALPRVVRTAVTEGSQRYSLEIDKWVGFISHAISTCYPGNPWGYKSFWGGGVPPDLSEINAKQVVEGIHNKIERLLDEGLENDQEKTALIREHPPSEL